LNFKDKVAATEAKSPESFIYLQYEHLFNRIDESLQEISDKYKLHMSKKKLRHLKAGGDTRRERKELKKLSKKVNLSPGEFHLLRYSQIEEKIENKNQVQKLWLSPFQIGEISTSPIVHALGYSIPRELLDCYLGHKHDLDCTFGKCMCGFVE